MTDPDRLVLLPVSFYLQPTLDAARALLGKTLIRRWPDGSVATGRVVETEAYTRDDPACHAFRGRTRSNQTMWGPPGRAYIYINYGLHYCLNAVTGPEGTPEAALIRALEPAGELAAWWRRAFGDAADPPASDRERARLTAGPGRLTRALGIDRSFDGTDLTDPAGPLSLASGDDVSDADVVTTTRIGITKGADFPWRFYVRASRFVSRR